MRDTTVPSASFGARLRAALDARGPLCAGVDPHSALLAAWGLSDDVAGLERFAGTVVEALADRVAVLKPQSAFFERFGSRGIAVLERTIADARAAGALVILDAKRGDIGSTVEAYAQAYLDVSSPLFSDAVTASPYLGYDSLEPLYATAEKNGAGVFVLAFTSNPEGASVQRALIPDDPGGVTVGAAILAAAARRNAGAEVLGSIGAVIGATVTDIPFDLATLNGPLLAPGLGAQGATPDDLRVVFGGALRNVVPATARELLRHGPDVSALREAVARSIDECQVALGY
ncbi:MAG TPA: orotidine-5'-phosphate decarboxylase [Actinocrinis sp.]|uniref:orotidine-5'-phosphate decarboxylase n=1 Tax=Actinocrinis sp. TaxID=1920516 RepID=UPI002DDD6611|nr:orotidine-5'-phosphate decarboxylase [Actinocrinis sp.]HEV2342541.1 orotidine-5'-phosphate decarboxylase [Actinocrinis sp.]